MINGIVFQRKDNRKYKGIDGDNWYLNDVYRDTLGMFFDEIIDKAWCDSNYVDVCNNENFIEKYIDLSQKNHIDFRMILCETDRQYPRIKSVIDNGIFIGYDYAYSGGSYYSAILNDICSQRINEFRNIKLNSYGLFDELEDIHTFIYKRNQLIKKSKNYVFEDGDFLIYKLYEIKPD